MTLDPTSSTAGISRSRRLSLFDWATEPFWTVDFVTVLCQEQGLLAAGSGRWYLLHPLVLLAAKLVGTTLTVIPRGNTALRPGDVAAAFVCRNCRGEMESALVGRRIDEAD